MDSINTLIPFAPYLFGGILAFGVVYIVAILLLGGVGDVDFGVDADVDFGGDADAAAGDGEAVGISLNVVAAFCVGVGAMGLVASLNDWSVLLTLLSSILFGMLLGRFFQVALRFVLRQQHNGLLTQDRLIGASGRVTVNTPAGRFGEALIDAQERIKYPVKHHAGAALQKGETIIVLAVDGGRLLVRKQDEE